MDAHSDAVAQLTWWAHAALYILIVYRVSRFISWDEVSFNRREQLRGWLLNRGAIGRHLRKLIGCALCISFWVSIVVVVIADFGTSVPEPVLMFAVVSSLSCFMLAIDGGRIGA